VKPTERVRGQNVPQTVAINQFWGTVLPPKASVKASPDKLATKCVVLIQVVRRALSHEADTSFYTAVTAAAGGGQVSSSSEGRR